jgi:LPXTG-motif cell wall-anchored protein
LRGTQATSGGECCAREKEGGKHMGKSRALIGTIGIALILAISAMAGSAANAVGPTTVGLGTATSFAVLAGSAISNTGSSVINGNIGSYPTTTITGFPPGIVNGTNHAGDAVTQGAKTDLTTAYNDAAGRTPVTTVPTELGGTTLVAGVYSSAAGTFGITGNVTLNGQGDPNSVFIFKMASTLTTATGSSVTLIGSAQSCNVFWQVGSSATLGGSTTFRGTILALTSITLVTSTTVDGRVLARNGAVTLDTNTITPSTCAAAATATPTPAATPTASPAPTATPAAATATPIAAPTATPAAPVGSLPSTSTVDRSGPLTLIGLLLAVIGALILRSRRSAPTVR